MFFCPAVAVSHADLQFTHFSKGIIGITFSPKNCLFAGSRRAAEIGCGRMAWSYSASLGSFRNAGKVSFCIITVSLLSSSDQSTSPHRRFSKEKLPCWNFPVASKPFVIPIITFILKSERHNIKPDLRSSDVLNVPQGEGRCRIRLFRALLFYRGWARGEEHLWSLSGSVGEGEHPSTLRQRQQDVPIHNGRSLSWIRG